MTIKRMEFEPIAVIASKAKPIPPETPGFANRTTGSEQPTEQVHTEILANNNSSNNSIEMQKALWQQGYDQARQEINQEELKTNELLKQLLANIESKLEEIKIQVSSSYQQNTSQMTNIAFAIAKKATKDFLDKNTYLLIKDSIEKAMSLLSHEPQLILSVHPKMEETIKPLLEEIKNKTQYKGDIIVNPDDNLHEINCIIEWQDGKIENNQDLLWKTIEQNIMNNNDSTSMTNHETISCTEQINKE